MSGALQGRCGSCMFFVPKHVTTGVRTGECRLGCWPSPLAETATCASYRAIGSPAPAQRSRSAGVRSPRVAGAAPRPEAPAIPQEIGIDMDQEEFRGVLRAILRDELGVGDVELGERWHGGEVVLIPGKAGTQEKRVPIDSLFRKVVLIREKLRVLEQRINNHEKLNDEDRLQLQQYLTQCYGSLTTFNVLFRNKDDQFSGQSGKDE